ncbi:MAG TPA: cyclic beta 1-2 glucan synthetase, partial [Verrucomicrobiae bacterium]|nr:cyclic beta 1-2 glucan synthetase [Verrucomicrobiae bacterium]
RHVVERVARHGKITEKEAAQLAVGLAQRHAGGTDSRTGHIGYYLLGDGLAEFERAAGARLPLRASLARLLRRFPLHFYLGGIGGASLGIASYCWRALAAAHSPPWLAITMTLLVLVCASQLAVAVINWLATVILRPHSLPRLDFEEGIPAEHCTLVVIPTLLTSPAGIDNLIDALEVRYLANRDANVYFGLLTDFADAPTEHLPADQALIRQAREEIETLNQRYRSDRPCIFYLFHRPRLWNEKEQVWMGYERKRGKLAELNRVLRGGIPENFSEIVGDLSILPRVKYVITLDTDTQLPRDAARQLAGTMAHPLNRPAYDPARGRVVDGYTILQPRVAVSLPGASRSRFAKLFAGDPGIDPYTRSVSDVYQDLFHEGSFIGKGIYDVDAFEQALSGKFPENRILSHDLIEGSYARSGLVTDVQLFEEFPARYLADTRRRHRWMRGDWQIATWLLPRVPGADARRVANPLSGLSRWKIFDNLRRSLVPVAVLALLVIGWIAAPRHAVQWSLLVTGIIFA